MRKNINRENTINRTLLGLILFLLALIVIGALTYLRASAPMRQAKAEATALAEKYAKMDEVDQFYRFTRGKTYFSLTGKNTSGKAIAVIIPKSGEKIQVLDQSKGLTEEQARATAEKEDPNLMIEKADLGLFEQKPVWEVVGKTPEGTLTYYLFSFENGEKVKAIKNI